MMLNTRHKFYCDKCNDRLSGHGYQPVNTVRGVKVFICENCGLAQSFYTKRYTSRPPGNLSCDADRSSIRYTKSLVSADYLAAIEFATKDFDQNSKISVLDIGSNRGAFFNLISKRCEKLEILCIEPDASVIDYEPAVGSVVVDRIENVILEKEKFDLIYCVHTLEHVISAKSELQKMFGALSKRGKLILGVPKLELYEDIIEEVFIDPHTYHFRHIDIVKYAQEIGFAIEYLSREDHHDVIAVLSKKHSAALRDCSVSDEIFSIKLYEKLLLKNRDRLNQVAEGISIRSKE